jgi:hypothetical protein
MGFQGLLRFKKAGWIALSILLFYFPPEFANAQINNPSTSIQKEWDSCSLLFVWDSKTPQTQDEYRMQRDSLIRFVETCAYTDYSHHAFSTITMDVQRYDETDTMRFNKYRDWLLSVVFLPTINTAYYCACVGAMVGTFQYPPYNKPNASIAVMKFLLGNPNCNDEGLRDMYNNSLKSRHESWLSSGDTSIPEDTVLPPLDSIGLGLLLHHSAVIPSIAPSQIYLASFTSSPNPFKNETLLRFHLNRMAYTVIGIYDVLGHQVWGDGKGRSLETGDHEIMIDGNSLPDGSLYARIETGFGEVKTVKLVKE